MYYFNTKLHVCLQGSALPLSYSRNVLQTLLYFSNTSFFLFRNSLDVPSLLYIKSANFKALLEDSSLPSQPLFVTFYDFHCNLVRRQCACVEHKIEPVVSP